MAGEENIKNFKRVLRKPFWKMLIKNLLIFFRVYSWNESNNVAHLRTLDMRLKYFISVTKDIFIRSHYPAQLSSMMFGLWEPHCWLR